MYSTAPQSPSSVRLADRAKHFGWNEVPASVVYATFDEVVANSEPNFTLLKKGSLGRQVSRDITHLISFSPGGRGGMYGFSWGVSLAYVPHEWSPKPKFHRTLKSARFALWENIEFVVTDPSSREVETYLVDAMHGEECMRSDLLRTWSKLQLRIRLFFEQSSNLEGVLNRATQHANRKWDSFLHFPDPKIVEAFTLARLGKSAEAETLLTGFIASQKSIESPQELLKALHTISP